MERCYVMDQTKEENYLSSVSDKELAETIDFAFDQEFHEIDPDFQSYYMKEIDRLRAYDALKVQLNILRKYKHDLEKYEHKKEAYEIKMKNLDELYKMFTEWQEKVSGDEAAYVENFYDDNIDTLIKTFPEIEDLCTNVVRKMIRTARDQQGISKVKDKYKITEPEKPEKKMDFKENQIDRSYSEKTNAELLELLGRNDLEYLADMIGDAVINQKTDKLRMAIRFVFAHYCQSNTKGKEYGRTDKQDKKDASKTAGKNIADLLKKYNSMLSE